MLPFNKMFVSLRGDSVLPERPFTGISVTERRLVQPPWPLAGRPSDAEIYFIRLYKPAEILLVGERVLPGGGDKLCQLHPDDFGFLFVPALLQPVRHLL